MTFPCLYILQSQKNGQFYIGSSKNFDDRKQRHFSGRSKYTKDLLPLSVVFLQEYETYSQARKAEIWLKKQKDRGFIQRIIKEGVFKKEF